MTFTRSLGALVLSVTLLGVSACSSTPGVRVDRASSVVVPLDASVVVVADQPEVAWATEQALRAKGWRVAPSQAGSSDWVLRAYVTQGTEIRQDSDPFCGPRGWRPYGWGYYGSSAWGGFYGSCDPFFNNDRTHVYSVRTVTWALGDQNNTLLWYASARETRPGGPPVALSDKLANALDLWRRGAASR